MSNGITEPVRLDRRKLRLEAIRFLARGISSFELVPADLEPMPLAGAGAHIDIVLPNGLARSYSLTNPGEAHRYVIAVHEAPQSRGGSKYLHRSARVGDLLEASAPRNLFPLEETAQTSILIAGGIGVTPIWAMVQRLEALGREWILHYCVRERALAAFLAPIAALEAIRPGRLHLHCDAEAGGPPDLAAIVAAAPRDAHLYCCGPGPMLDAFELATDGWRPAQVHLERFAPKAAARADQGYVVELARSRREVRVAPGTTLLEALIAAGIEMEYSCMAGICGSCETRVLSGRPDHQDSVLTESQQASNQVMMVCCSGALDERLVLDL